MKFETRLFHLAPSRLSHRVIARHFYLITFCVVIWLSLILCSVPPAFGQTNDDYAAERKRALQLCEENKFIDALSILEKLNKSNPKDVVVLEKLAFTLVVAQATFKDAEERKRTLIRARALASQAKELGSESEYVRLILDQIPADGVMSSSGSANKEVDDAIQAGEAAFAKGDFKKAIDAYQRAATLDPQLYVAPLYIGDVYFKMNDVEKAGEWFAKAIALEPNRETAYRYWGDALMSAGKMKEARAKFIEAIIAEPYDRRPWVGLSQWGQQNKVPLSHPAIDPPSSVKVENGKTNILISPEIGKNDGSSGWLIYSITRASWVNGKFAKEFPNEKEYRHSLREEVEALQMVADATAIQVKEGKLKTSSLEPSLANLLKLHEAGLLEAYILLGKPDAGIARDYAAYRQANRDKLRRYLSEYVIHDNK